MRDLQVRHRRAAARCGFSLVEAMVALAITTMAASALLLALETSLSSATETLEKTIAMGIAEQLLDEALGQPYVDKVTGSPLQAVLSASGDEILGKRRDLYDDIDDYNDRGTGYDASPPVDAWGVELGQGNGRGGLRHPNFRAPAGSFDGWREEIEVYYVDENNKFSRLASGTSNYRAVEVRIYRQQTDGTILLLAQLRRVHAYVPK